MRPWIRIPMLALAAALGLGAIGVTWLVGTTSGAALVLAAAGLRSEGLDGRISGRLQAASLQFTRPSLRIRIERPDIDWAPLALAAGRFEVLHLRAETIEIARAATKERSGLPAAFEPPLEIHVREAAVRSLRIGELSGAGAFSPRLAFDELAASDVSGGRSWRFRQLRAKTAVGALSLAGTLGSRPPFDLEAAAQLSGSREGRRYDLAAQARGTLAKFEADLRGTEEGIRGDARATIAPFEAQPLRRLQAKLHGIDLKAFAPAMPRTRIDLDADLAPGSEGVFAGSVQLANADAGPLDRGLLPVVRARSKVRISGERYEFTEATLAAAGSASAAGSVVVEGSKVHAHLDVRDVDLASLHGKLRPTKLTGTVVTADLGGARRYEVALSDPRFEISGVAVHEAGWLKVEDARIVRGTASAKFSGALELAGAQRLEVDAEFDRLDPAAYAAVPSGELNFRARANGRLSPGLAGEVALELSPSRFAGLALAGHLRAQGDERRLARGDVALSLGEARLEAKGALGAVGDVLDFRLAVPDAAPIARALGAEAGGRLEAQARFSGTLADPGIRIEAKSEALRLPGLPRAGTASLGVEGSGARHRATLDASFPESRLKMLLQGGLDAKSAKVAWRGTVEASDLSGPNPVKLVAPAALVVSRDVVELGEAVLRSDLGDARLALTRWTPERIEARGASEGVLTRTILRLLGITPHARSSLVLAVDWDVNAAQALDGHVRARRVRGDVRVGDQGIALGIERFDAGIEAVRGAVKARVAIGGSRLGELRADLETQVGREGGAWSLPKDAPLSGEVAARMPSIAWAAGFLGPDTRLEGRLEANVNVGGTLAAPTWKGHVAAEDLRLHDSTLGFEIDEGRVRLGFDEREVAIESFELASAWRESRRAERRLAEVRAPEKGTITAGGRLDFATRAGTIKARMRAYPVSQLPARFLAASGDAELVAGESGLAITGSFRADAGFFSIPDTAPPTLSDDVLVDRGGGVAAAPRERQRLVVDLRFGLGEQLHFSGRGLSTRLAGDVRLRGEPGRNLQTTGQIRTVGGTYNAYGQRLAIERGVLNFQGAIENPGLNVLAVREGLAVVAGVEILGTVARPAVRLHSRPEVPDHEKLSWLVLGRGPLGANETDIATLVAAANALLGASRENRRLVRQFGFDELRVSRADTTSALGVIPQSTVAGRTGSGNAPEVFTVGKRLTKDLYVSYQHSLADAEAILRFTYNVTQKLQLLLRASNRPGFDAVYRFSFD